MVGTPCVRALILFRCEECRRPLAISVPSEEGNQRIDGDMFRHQMQLWVVENFIWGMNAVRHWVVKWEV